MMNILDLKGICVGTSSACATGKGKSSHVLLALGLSEEEAKTSIRVSYGYFNTEDDAKEVASAICDAYERIIKK